MPFAIDDLTSVIGHWSADAIVGLVDGDPVDALPDSISSWDLAGTTTTRPLYRPTSSINSLPAIEFDGVDDYLASASKVVTCVNPCVILVANCSTIKFFNMLMAITTTSATPVYTSANTRIHDFAWLGTSGTTGYGNTSESDGTSFSYTQTQFSGAASFTTSTNTLVSCMHGFRQRGLRLNGGVMTQTSGGNDRVYGTISGTSYAWFSKSNIGTEAFAGLVAEIVFFDETVASESLYIEGVLAHKYGITLPTTHPFYAAAPTSGPPTGAGGGLMKIGQGGGYNG